MSLQREVCETRERIVLLYWPSLRNNNMATNFRRLQVTVVYILPQVTTERRYFGRSCSETVTADSGKPRRFVPMVGELRVADILCAAPLDE